VIVDPFQQNSTTYDTIQ